ncbi:MAG TPA: SDR family oxidoreductase [Candidatus Xenobia bacterium]|jgi:uncharacterized protein YbjT (DUF2867 family)
MSIFVTGATGTIGKDVVRGLQAKGAAVKALSRSPRDTEGRLQWVQGDLDSPQSLDLAGVETLFLLTGVVKNQVDQARQLLDRARQAGVKRVVKLSVIGADLRPGIQLTRWHGEVEELLRQSGLGWTFLRPNTFLQNFITFNAATIREHSAFYTAQGEGRVSYVDTRDIAAVAVEALLDAKHDGHAYTLTGPQALTAAAAAEVLSDALKRPIQAVHVSDDAYRQGMLKSGMPDWMVELMMELNATNRVGTFSAVSTDIATVLGREPISAAQFARDFSAELRPLTKA